MSNNFNLIDQAKHFFDNFVYFYFKINKNPLNRDYYIRDCCFMLYLTSDLLIKHLVEKSSKIDYNLDLFDNIKIIKKNKKIYEKFNVLEPLLNSLLHNKELLTKWHTQAIYNTKFSASIRRIYIIEEICEKIIKYCSK